MLFRSHKEYSQIKKVLVKDPILEKAIEFGYGDIIDKALKKFGSGSEKKGAHAYLSTMWDDMAGDALHDAMQSIKGSGPRYDSPFIDWDKSGNPHKRRNPWK